MYNDIFRNLIFMVGATSLNICNRNSSVKQKNKQDIRICSLAKWQGVTVYIRNASRRAPWLRWSQPGDRQLCTEEVASHITINLRSWRPALHLFSSLYIAFTALLSGMCWAAPMPWPQDKCCQWNVMMEPAGSSRSVPVVTPLPHPCLYLKIWQVSCERPFWLTVEMKRIVLRKSHKSFKVPNGVGIHAACCALIRDPSDAVQLRTPSIWRDVKSFLLPSAFL